MNPQNYLFIRYTDSFTFLSCIIAKNSNSFQLRSKTYRLDYDKQYVEYQPTEFNEYQQLEQTLVRDPTKYSVKKVCIIRKY